MPDIAATILENEGLIYKTASYFSGYGSIEDLYQAGCIGIMKGAQNYDPNKGAKFSTYIYSYIIGEMKTLVREDKPVKVSRDISRLRGSVEKARDMLSQSLMREPTDVELSEYLDIDEYYLAEALNSSVRTQSIDDNVGDTNMMMHEVISSPDVDIDDLLYLKTELESLGEPERTIMISRYYEDMTQSQIADSLGTTQVDVSRREGRVLSKLRSSVH